MTEEAIFFGILAIKEAVKFWRYWLMRQRFRVIIDQKPVEGKESRSRPNEELRLMIHFLSQFDFDIKL